MAAPDPAAESRVSLPEPDAYLSWTVTDARTAPDLPTYPLELHQIGMRHNAVVYVHGEVVGRIAASALCNEDEIQGPS